MAVKHGGLLTLLTDFGGRDPYVGILKGVIAQVNPSLQVIDLTHEIPPQDVGAARFSLMISYSYFPPGTVHVAVVDPGVGSQRRSVAIAVQLTPNQRPSFLVGPDNGLFSGVLSRTVPLAAVELTNRQYWRTPQPSHTFHGRDIFAAVAAHLASGVPLDALGTAIDVRSLVSLPSQKYQIEHHPEQAYYLIHGTIQAIDYYGNLITNIPSIEVGQARWWLMLGPIEIESRTTYADGQPQEVLALLGSHGWVEVAVNQGNAQEVLGLAIGDTISVLVQSPRE